MTRPDVASRNVAICAAYINGTPAAELAVLHDVSVAQIYMIIRRDTVAAAAKGGRLEKAVIAALSPDRTVAEVAEASGASENYSYAVAVRQGVRLRSPTTVADSIRALIETGRTAQEIADAVGTSRSYVYSVRRMASPLSVKPRSGAPVAMAIRAAVAGGMTATAAARAVGCAAAYAQRVAKRMRLDR